MKDEEILGLPDEGSFLNPVSMRDLGPSSGTDPDSGAPQGRAVPRRGYRILYPMLAVLAFVALAPLASLSWRFMSRGRETLATTQQEYQLLLASSIAEDLDSHVEGLQAKMEAISGSFANRIQANGLDGLERSFADGTLLGGFLDENLIGLHFEGGDGRSFEAREPGFEPGPGVERLIAGAARELLQGGGKETRISPPVVTGREGRAVIVIASAVRGAHGEPGAVVAGVADLSRVWDRVALANRNGNTIYALDAEGNLFARTDDSISEAGSGLKKTEIVQRFLTGEGRRKETMLFSLPDGSGKSRRYLGSYESTSLGWGIFVQLEESQAYAIIQDMVKDTLRWSLAALVVAGLAAILFAGKLSQPVKRLTNAAREFSRGNFSARATVGGRDEIGELAENFNRMAGEIEDYIAALKEAAKENNDLFLGTIRALAQAIDAKDPYTRGHSVRVSHYAVATANRMKLPSRILRDVYIAALLHDIGKIGIEDAILKKPSNLTEDEFEIMKGHPDKGARIMAKVDKLKTIIPGMRHHHERFSGGGYPDGLKGEEIPVGARIINVADSFDAMTTDRPYSRAMTFAAAISRLRQISGTQVDPKVVDAFVRAYEAGEFAAEEKRMAQKGTLSGSNEDVPPAAPPPRALDEEEKLQPAG
jgi:HD-GYP domain-containing protein (c-di-GMP phosphodiesterase class II)